MRRGWLGVLATGGRLAGCAGEAAVLQLFAAQAAEPAVCCWMQRAIRRASWSCECSAGSWSPCRVAPPPCACRELRR